MIQAKSLLIGAVAALVVELLGIGLAHAETDREDIVRSETEAYSDMARGKARGYDCELIRLEDGRLEAQCDQEAWSAETLACDAFVDATYDASVGSGTRHLMHEACMVVAVHTGAVR